MAESSGVSALAAKGGSPPEPAGLVLATTYPWPARDGVAAKLGALVTALPGRVTMISPAPQGPERLDPPPHVDVRPLRTRPRRRAAGLAEGVVRRHLVTPGAWHGVDVATLVAETARRVRPDYVHVDTMALAHLVPRVRAGLNAAGLRAPVVLSINDSYSLLRSTNLRGTRLAAGVECRFVRHVERRWLTQPDAVDIVSHVDLDYLTRLVPGARLRLIPLGVAPPPPSSARPPIEREILVFSAPQGLTPFLAGAMPIVRAARPDVRVSMVGPTPGPSTRSLALDNGVEVLGFVPDIDHAVRSSSVVVAPSQQLSGMSNKAVLAMRLGTPLVGGVCLYGIPGLVAGEHALVGQDPGTLASSLLSTLADPAEAGQRAARAYTLVSSLPGWPDVARRYLDTLPEVAE